MFSRWCCVDANVVVSYKNFGAKCRVTTAVALQACWIQSLSKFSLQCRFHEPFKRNVSMQAAAAAAAQAAQAQQPAPGQQPVGGAQGVGTEAGEPAQQAGFAVEMDLFEDDEAEEGDEDGGGTGGGGDLL